ncbi:MAG: outer membrane beta-barrel protein [Pseudomonadota bacterium]
MNGFTKFCALTAASLMAVTAGVSGASAQSLKDEPRPVRKDGAFTGLYIGGQVGGIDGDIDWNFTNNSQPTPNPLNADGAILGGILGYQRQFGFLVLGVETTFSGVLDADSTSTCPNAGFTCEAELGSIFTAGGRIGLANNIAMIYFTGGYANAGVETNTTDGVLVDPVDERLDGFYIGGGVDWQPIKNLVFGIEYRHYDFDASTLVSGRLPGVDDRNIGLEADSVMARMTWLLK